MTQEANQDFIYEEAVKNFGSSLDRLARGYEFDPEARRDLLQEIHIQLWLSFNHFDHRCSLKTWVYRVAHNVACRYVIRQRNLRERLVKLEDVEYKLVGSNGEVAATHAEALEQLSIMIRKLKPLDRQIILSYLEGFEANEIGELTGLSPANIAMKVHRIKNILKRWFAEGEIHAG